MLEFQKTPMVEHEKKEGSDAAPRGYWYEGGLAPASPVWEFLEQEDKVWNWFDGSWNRFKIVKPPKYYI